MFIQWKIEKIPFSNLKAFYRYKVLWVSEEYPLFKNFLIWRSPGSFDLCCTKIRDKIFKLRESTGQTIIGGSVPS